jgi:hypothetical protein
MFDFWAAAISTASIAGSSSKHAIPPSTSHVPQQMVKRHHTRSFRLAFMKTNPINTSPTIVLEMLCRGVVSAHLAGRTSSDWE